MGQQNASLSAALSARLSGSLLTSQLIKLEDFSVKKFVDFPSGFIVIGLSSWPVNCLGVMTCTPELPGYAGLWSGKLTELHAARLVTGRTNGVDRTGAGEGTRVVEMNGLWGNLGDPRWDTLSWIVVSDSLPEIVKHFV